MIAAAQPRWLVWAVLGAVVATPLDALHVVTGTIAYAHTPLGLQDWWAPLLFAVSGVAMGYGHRHGARRLAGTPTLPVARLAQVACGLGAFVVSYASSGLLKGVPLVALAFYVAMFLGCVVMTPREARKALLFHSAGIAVCGPAVEATLSSLGMFHYLPASEPLWLGVPLWLPGIYLCAAAGTAALDRALP